jgi:peptidase E
MAMKHRNIYKNVNTELFNDLFVVSDLNQYDALFLLSDLDYTDKSLFNVFKKALTGKEKISFIASTPDDSKTTDMFFKDLKKYFKKLGLREFVLIDHRTSKYHALQAIKSSDIIFLTGGNPITQLSFIIEYEMDGLIADFKGIIIGVSAGAINMAKTSYCSKDKDFSETQIYEGLGLTDLTIEPHFDLKNKEQVNEFLAAGIEIIGLPDETFMKVDKYGVKTVYGEYYIKKNDKLVKER